MYPYGSPYVPMMYPSPYGPYQPYMGPLVYRHPGMYPGIGGKSQVRGALPKQSASKVKVAAQPALPVQRDDEDRIDSPRASATPPKAAASKQPTPPSSSQSAKKSGQKRMVAVNMMPRMPMYQPYYAYPQYVIPPDDPRYMQMPLQPPFYYSYPNMPRHPYPYMMPQPVHVQMQPRPGSGSVSPASSDGAVKGNQPSSPTDSSQSDAQSMSPGSSSGQHIQLLPNVKHAPTHLLYSASGSGSNSRSSTPVLANSPAPQQQGGMTRDSPRNSQGEMEFPTFRRRHHSGPRPVSQSPSYSSQGSHESSTSPVLNGDQAAAVFSAEGSQNVTYTETKVKSHSKSIAKTEKQTMAAKAPRALKLNTNTTGFSRQFSDELGTPTEITNIVRMIEENIDEVDEEDVERTADILFRKEAMHHSKPSPPAGKLFLNLPVQKSSNETIQSSSSSSHEEDVMSSYARAVRQQLPSYRETDFDPSMLEPQTPMTPAGFHTPGTDMNTDPLELLRNLNINNDNLNKSAHGHF